MLVCVVSCGIVMVCVALYSVVLCRVIVCYVALCRVVLGCVVLSGVVLCCGPLVPCVAFLFFSVLSRFPSSRVPFDRPTHLGFFGSVCWA